MTTTKAMNIEGMRKAARKRIATALTSEYAVILNKDGSVYEYRSNHAGFGDLHLVFPDKQVIYLGWYDPQGRQWRGSIKYGPEPQA